MPKANANRFIVSSLLCMGGNFPIVRALLWGKAVAAPTRAFCAGPCGPRTSANKECFMPEVVVYILEGRTQDQKRGLIKDITSAVVKNAGVPAEAVVVSLVETAKTDK